VLSIETHGRVRLVTLERPEARNAVNPALARLLYEAMLEFEANPDVDVAVLTGANGAFCAGFDLKAAATGAAEEWIARLDIPETWRDPVGQPLASPMGPARLMLSKPVIAAIEGPAVAGGLELALWCDLRVLGRGAQLGVFCRRWGVPLVDGGTVRLPRIVGQGRANDLILTGRPVEADEALAIALVDRVVQTGGARDADHLSARLSPEELAHRLRREWRSVRAALAEGVEGAARFAAGHGRGGRFDDI